MALIQQLDEVLFLTPDSPKTQIAYLDISPDGKKKEWKPVRLPTTEGVARVVYDNELGRLYAATDGGVLFASDDKGESWFKVESGKTYG